MATTNYDQLYSNVNAGIGAGLEYVPADRHKRVMLSAYNPITRPATERSGVNPSLIRLNDAINKMPALPTQSGVINMGGTNIWSFLNPVGSADPYSGFAIDAQRHIESFRDFARRAKGGGGGPGRFFGLDIETLGDTDSKNFFISEISANGINYRGGQYTGESKTHRFNKLVAPNKHMQGELNKLIRKVQIGQFALLNPSEQRTVVDLIRYSSIGGNGISAATFGAEVMHNSAINSVLSGKTILTDEITRNQTQYLRHMRDGIKNLVKHGADYASAIDEYNAFVGKHKNSYFVTMNGDSFDLERMRRFSSITGKEMVLPQNHMDYYRVMQSVARNPIKLHEQHGRPSSLPFEEGPWSLAEWRRTLGMSTAGSHSASFDTGMNGVGGLVANTWNYVDDLLGSTEVKADYKPRQLGQRTPYLMHSNKPLTTSDLLFATRGVRNYKGSQLDYQAELTEDGSYKIFRPGFNQNVINAESFYRVAGVRDLSSGGVPKWAIEFVNQDNPQLRSFVVREGENAAYEIADFYHRSFTPMSNISKKMRKQIQHLRESDLGRRRYESLFSLDKKSTAGFDAAKRMYANAAVYNKFTSGRWSAIEAEASRKLDELTMKNGQFMRSWTPEQYDQAREKIIGRLLKQRISRDEMKGMMNFNSLWDGTSKSFVYNPDEEKAFWKMLPRLMSEHSLYQGAIEAIDASGMEAEQKNIAWSLFHERVNESAGQHKTVRASLPYEQNGFQFRDRLTGKSVSVSLQNANNAINSFRSYVFKGTGDLAETEKAVERAERFKILLSSLKGSGIIDDDYVQGAITGIHDRKLTIPASIEQLALDLMEQQHLTIRRITEESLGRRESVERISKQAGQQLVKSAIKQTQGMRGYLLNNGFIPGPGTDIGDMFAKLDRQHKFTGMNPNNRQAIEGMMGTLKKMNPSLNMALSMNPEATQAFITMFHPDDSASVLRHMAGGASEAHPKAFEFTVPLINQQGTLVYGNRHFNATRDIIRVNGVNSEISTVEKMGHMLADPRLLDHRSEWNINTMAQQLKDGELSEATASARRLMNNFVSELSGVKRDFNENLLVTNTEADLLKQGLKYPAAAMIQQYYEDGTLTDRSFRNTDVILNAGKKQLIPFVKLDDLHDEAKFMIRRDMPEWLEKNGFGRGFYSSAKADVVARGGIGSIDARNLFAYGHFTVQNRDNSVQAMNSYRIDKDLEASLKEAEGVASTNHMVSTAVQRQHSKLYPYKPEVYVNTVMANQADVTRRVDDLIAQAQGDDNIRRILTEEGILRADGSVNVLRKPNVYEQQMIFNKDLVNRLQTKNYKYYRGDEIKWDGKYLDADGQLRRDMVISPGDRLGTRIVDGQRQSVFYDQKYAGRIASARSTDNAFAIEYTEQANKVYLDIEKGTIGGNMHNGQYGYGSEFLKELFGEENVGVVYNPNIGKHGDLGGALRGQANKLMYTMQNAIKENVLNEADIQEAMRMINQGRIGVNASYKNGELLFDDVSAKYKRMDYRNFGRLYGKLNDRFGLGLAESNSAGYITGVQAMRIAQVQNYSTVVDEQRRAVLKYNVDDNGNLIDVAYKEGGDVKGVKYGFRELGMLQVKGLDKTREHMFRYLVDQSKETGRLQEAIGMVNALRGAVEGPGFDPDFENRTLRLHDFHALPTLDTNLTTISRTILDDEHVRKLVGENDYHGFWMELPNIHVNGQKEAILPEVEGRKMDRVFIPFTKTDGKGEEIWLRDMRRHIADIYRRAEAVTKADGESAQVKAMQGLNRSLGKYFAGTVSAVTASSDQTGNSVLKVNMPTSSSGLAKVMPIEESMRLDGETVFINPNEAKTMGIYEHLLGGNEGALHNPALQKDFYAPDLRFPTFTENAIQSVKIKMDPSVPAGFHNTTSLLASLLKEDSDGDYNHIVAIHDQGVQEELARNHAEQREVRAARHEQAYQNALNNSMTYEQALNEGELKLDSSREFSLKSIFEDYNVRSGKEKGLESVDRFEANQLPEIMAKSGKEFIGRASDLNYRMRQVADTFYADSPEVKGQIYKLGQGLEQDLTISSKHGTGQGLFTKSGAADLLSAIERGNTKQAIEVDNKYFNGQFGDNLKLAMGHLTRALDVMKKGMDNPELRAGTSQGMRLGDHSLEEIVDTIMGRNPNATTANPFLNPLQDILRSEGGMTIDRPQQPSLTPEYRKVNPLEPFSSSPMTKRLEGPAGTIAEMIEDGTGGMLGPKAYEKISGAMDKFFNGKNGPRNKKAALIGGLALAGIMGYNTFNDKDPVMPYNPESETEARADAAALYGGTPAPAMAPIDAGNSGANIKISAQGSGSQNFGPMLGQAMQRSGYNGGKINMSVNQSDNANRLNRIWYRDKVQQYS
ncbi:hypothetical protein SAMN02799624_05434 [Paenibacillus sp. UNC496MF]|uniref:hypothetical protein n=1 Tax=Paenibacillus sp. UNC496MF TaxID=1502753 RepID=UPI0008E22CC9|nr:hypothetical protein [Paenibacillus sp. UNC496MF]SFJ66102.1 hypothetical protein SAMN02799624_05434 [Paenibacillus sp. UNC496MF]